MRRETFGRKAQWSFILLLVVSGSPRICREVRAAEGGGWRQPVTVSYRSLTVADVLEDLGKRAGVKVGFDGELVRDLENVTYQGRDQEAGRVLARILRPRGLRIEDWYRSPARVMKRDPYDELKARRESTFEFARKPVVTREGDRITVAFETRAFCDCTVAIENAGGKIVRHLASGVLGENAPEPFQWNSKKQTVVWDGKDDQGVYVDDKDGCIVRVSLGLKPRFEKNLLWSPHRRISSLAPVMCAAPEGVYVAEGQGVDHVRLFDHEGNYVRTLYPFAREKLERVVGLEKRAYPHDGAALPVKNGFQQATLLSAGSSSIVCLPAKINGGDAATTLAVSGTRIALAQAFLNRLSTDGTTGGLALKGPRTDISSPSWKGFLGPVSSAFSPDGRFLYLTGYHYVANSGYGPGSSFHGVYRLEYARDEPPEVFLGQMAEDKYGKDNASFRVPRSVACDGDGRVYVADYMNDRIQIFSAEGRHLKSLATPKPAKVCIHGKTGEIYVFSYPGFGVDNAIQREAKSGDLWKLPPTVSRFGPFSDPKAIDSLPLPIGPLGGGLSAAGTPLSVELDSWAEPPQIWLAGLRHITTSAEIDWWGLGTMNKAPWKDACVKILVLQDGKWVVKRAFGDDAEKALVRVKPPDFARQRLIVNPATGKLYVAEDLGLAKSFMEVLEIDPETGKKKVVQLPFDAEDMCFDADGAAYLRTDTIVVRYDSTNWREIPWDYGEEQVGVAFCGHISGRSSDVQAGLKTPGSRLGNFHEHGMAVSSRGRLVVSCTSSAKPPPLGGKFGNKVAVSGGRPYSPRMYPGRARRQEIHVWDKHGKLLFEDAVPGTVALNGVALDGEDNVYVWADATRAFGGKPWVNPMTGTLMKFRPGEGRVLTAGGTDVPLPPASQPKRDPDFLRAGTSMKGWVEGAQWLFGAGGWFGFNMEPWCDCWHARFSLDYFGRSFVPEMDLYSVAVLDSQGNVVVRVGQYGNADDGVPLVSGGVREAPVSPASRAMGGDEVALVHAAYVGTHSDRRLFIQDAGNSRVISVGLGYHTDERIALKDVADRPTVRAEMPSNQGEPR